ncbi:TraR/DksA family transcriptional regulator [Serratia marcescens]|uniref:TraR/DksA family transcriptional regulator n=1 Tax=Serratia marcescens TaxID=615 RepID=UPI000651EF13|nr:TraR/DksA family transcriptional regulator [Serratia marcescens]AWC71339.1 hypothetical protein AM368_14515 [Serratia marcescens]AWC89306.1 hypothetical protein AM370_10245 [Serratia marcescens]AWS58489.1 TraR/DksA family transcriptional regulator [Serratia marcescens]AWS69868.1 hypothetical protein AM378_16275 [Serratia marcescens]EIY2713076.1 TraR/DksA family transcriptional regulator [Serratia marcescens]
MADLMDYEQERQALVLNAQIANARKSSALPSAFVCEECDAPIPAARRAIISGVTRCVTCQEIQETKSQHFKG